MGAARKGRAAKEWLKFLGVFGSRGAGTCVGLGRRAPSIVDDFPVRAFSSVCPRSFSHSVGSKTAISISSLFLAF